MEFKERDDFVHNVLYAYFRWAWLVAVVFVFLFSSVFFMAWLLTPTWGSKAYLALDPTMPPPTSRFADPTRLKGERMDASYAYQAVQILTGREMAFAVVAKFDLAERRRQKSEDPQDSREAFQAGFESAMKSTVDFVKWIFRVQSEDKKPDWADKAARAFHDGLFASVTAKPVTDTDIVELEVCEESPELANAIVDFMLEELRRQLVVRSVCTGQEAVAAFEKQLADVQGMEQEAEQALQAYMEAHGGVDPGEDARLKTIERDTVQSGRDRLQVEASALQREVDRLAAGEPPVFSERLLQNELVRQLRVKLQELGLRRAVLEGELTDAHPDVMELDRQILRAEEDLAGEILAERGTVQSELRGAEEHLLLLESELKAISQQQLSFSRLQSDVQDWQSLRRDLQEHVQSIRVASASNISPLVVRVLDRMRVSPVKNPDSPIWLLVAVIALIFATGGAVIVPPFIEYWRDPIRGRLDLLHEGINPLVVVPSAKWGRCSRWVRRLRGRAYVESERVANQWHDLAAALTLESREKGDRWCVVVTESDSRIGGGEVCRHVAEQASRMGQRVVVLSVSSPEPSGQFSLAGAVQPLAHKWDDVRSPLLVSLPAFFGALPACGTRPADWVTEFDLMIVYAPEADTQLQIYLGKRSDAVILIADSRRQSLSNVVRLSKSIVASGCRLLGVVLSGHTSPIPAWLDRWNDRPV